MVDICVLRQREIVRLDPDRLEELVEQLGSVGAENVVCRAMEELAVRLTHLEKVFRDEDWSALRKGARALSAIADQVGMCGLARVAGHVVDCVDSGNAVSRAATVARLMRVGEHSLTAVWDLQDVTV